MNAGTSTADDSPSRAGGLGGVYVCAGFVILFLLYFFSPTFLFLALRLGLPFPSPQVLEILGVFWMPLQWYAESGLPGAAEYVAFLNWLAGNP